MKALPLKAHPLFVPWFKTVCWVVIVGGLAILLLMSVAVWGAWHESTSLPSWARSPAFMDLTGKAVIFWGISFEITMLALIVGSYARQRAQRRNPEQNAGANRRGGGRSA